MHDTIWAPWRLQYLQTLDVGKSSGGGLEDFLAHAFEHPGEDEPNYVVHRTGEGLIMLNRYPYANGHLLVALGEARPRMTDYPPESRAALWALIETGMDMVHCALNPQGINMGINEGAASGAGLPGHLHAHIVPRWNGDVNFMSTVAATRVVPASLEDMATLYRTTTHR